MKELDPIRDPELADAHRVAQKLMQDSSAVRIFQLASVFARFIAGEINEEDLRSEVVKLEKQFNFSMAVYQDRAEFTQELMRRNYEKPEMIEHFIESFDLIMGRDVKMRITEYQSLFETALRELVLKSETDGDITDVEELIKYYTEIVGKESIEYIALTNCLALQRIQLISLLDSQLQS